MDQEQLNVELLEAAMYGDTKSVEECLARGADVNYKDRDGRSALYLASRCGWTEIVSRLVDLGADVNAKDDEFGWSALYWASLEGRTEMVSRLLDLGADVNTKDDEDGQSALYLASCGGWTEMVSRLLDSGADVNTKDNKMEQDKAVRKTGPQDQFQKREHSVMLNRLLGQGSYESYDMRIMVTGQFGVGKTSLVLILVGDVLPNERRATDGIFLMEGRCGLGIEGKDWIVIKKEDYDALDVVYNKVLTSSLEIDTKVKQTTTMQKNEVSVQKQLSPNTSPETRTAINVTTSEGKLKHTEDMPRKNIIPKVTKDAIRKKMEAVLKSGKYKMKTGRIIFWDFGGQYVYYTTHQTFMTYRALFLVVFDGSKGLYEKVGDVMCFPGQQGTPTPAVFLQHWVNSILTYCKLMYPGIPKILFVATHKDKVDQSAFEKTRKSLYADVEKLFKDHHGRQHLILEHQLFVNATDKNDEGIKVLKKVITDLTFGHPCWGEPMPNAWIPLELEIAEMSAEGKQILSYKDVEDLNNSSEVSVLSKEDLKFFLEFQHSLGKIVYFDTPQLRDYVIIGPLFLIEVMKSFVTDQQFWPNDRKIKSIFTKMSNEGVIKKSHLYMIWEKFEKIRPHKDFILNILVHLDILSEQRRYDLKTGSRQFVDAYFVPCMLIKQDRTNLMDRYMKNECIPGRAISLAFVFKSTIIPPALPNRLISACLSMWVVKEYDHEKLMFPGFVALSWDKTHDIVLCVLSNKILVYVIHESEKGLIVGDIATGVRECLHTTLERIFEFYQSTSSTKKSGSELPFHVELACSDLNCYLREKTALENRKQPCSEHNKEYNISVWYQAEDDKCDSSCKGLTPTALQEKPSDLQLFRLSRKLDIDLMLPLALNLGLTQVEFNDEKSNYHSNAAMFKFHVLINWREKQNGTFNDLHVALPLKEVGSNVHELCKVNRMIMTRKYTVIEEEHLNSIPTDKILDALAPSIATHYLFLGMELGLNVADVETIEHNNKNNLCEINKCILQKWRKDKKKIKPTLDVLQRALVNVGRGLYDLKRIIDEIVVQQHHIEKPVPHKSGLSSNTSETTPKEGNTSQRAEPTKPTKREGNTSQRTEHTKSTSVEGNPSHRTEHSNVASLIKKFEQKK